MTFGRRRLLLAILATLITLHSSVLLVDSFTTLTPKRCGHHASLAAKKKINADELDLKAELTEYLEKRRELKADEQAKEKVGQVVGGTRGNPVLDYISGVSLLLTM